MSVIIKNTDIPQTCDNCRFAVDVGYALKACLICNKNVTAEVWHRVKHNSCPLKSVEGLIEKIKDESYLSYDGNPRHILDEEAVIQIIKDYCGVSDHD